MAAPPIPSDSGRGILLLYVGLTLLSLNGLFAKLIPLDAFSITQLRSLVAIGGFYLFCRFFGMPLGVQSVKQLLGIYGLGVVMGVHWGTFFHAMQISTVAVGILALFSYPMITILLEPIFTRSRLSTRDVFSGLLVLVGLLIMVWEDLGGGLSGNILQGAFWGVFSALLFSLRNLCQKYYFAATPSSALMFHQLVAIALLFIPVVDLSTTRLLGPYDWLLLVLLGFLGTAAAHTLYTVSLKLLAAKTVSLIGCMQPVVSILLAWIILREVPSVAVLIGGSIVLIVAIAESLVRSR
ncbi:DMT family transporter [Pelovirga terrestris]|uniref:DMT family transporter n=1 Tax=Pelovirga terrestris TaxID=2771352 RepID=A0A8J6QS09_9BACT|nr:DMT family transporter [Pelovirga terrestris]MBD1401363.1 DMT family transporter [Pelovirga terrestris]